MIYQRYKRYATNGERVVWREGDARLNDTKIFKELSNLKLKCDLAVWQNYSEEWAALVMSFHYSPSGYKVQVHPFVSWEEMSDDEARDFFAPSPPDDPGRYE